MIALYWLSASQQKQLIPSTAFFNPMSKTPITGISFMIQAIDVPMSPTNLAQDGSLTYAHTSITLTWSAPLDTGCLPILGYKFQIYNSGTSTWADAVSQSMNGAHTGGAVNSLTAGVLAQLRIVAMNSLGYGTPSQSIQLTPAALPSAPGSIIVTAYGGDYLALSWTSPTDTGASDSSTISLTKY